MKLHDVVKRAQEEGGEYVLGLKDTGTHACYLIYGTLKPNEEGRLIKPGAGHEELVMATKGSLKISGPAIAPVKEMDLLEGSAFLIAGDVECFLKNPSADSEAAYTCAGGHTPGGHH